MNSIRNSASPNTFKKKLLNFIRPCANSIFDILYPLGIKLLTRLRLGDSLCECIKDIGSTMHIFLHSTSFLIPRQVSSQKIKNIDNNIFSKSETQLIQTLLYGSQNYNSSINNFIKSTSNTYYRLKDSNAGFLIKAFYEQGCVLH